MEKRNRPAVREDYLGVALACYALWRQVSSVIANEREYFVAKRESAYAAAADILSPHACVFASVGADGLEALLRQIENDNEPLAGSFVSALLNETGLPVMSGRFRGYSQIGYRIKPGKMLILEKGSLVDQVGYEGTGGGVVSLGSCWSLGAFSKGGLYVNLGGAVRIGSRGGDSVRINFANHRKQRAVVRSVNSIVLPTESFDMAYRATGGLDVNLCWEYAMGTEASSGTRLNYGVLNLLGIGAASESRAVNAGRMVPATTPYHLSVTADADVFRWKGIVGKNEFFDIVNRKGDGRAVTLAREIRRMCFEARDLVTKSAKQERSAETIAAYDWAGFEAGIRARAGEMGKHLGDDLA
ncbi:TPA: hypothetical protein HA231_01845 [Candidatus Woesearchaeota archaeon]|nr:hypothetical protein [Candidatus Woesearchaeota archaeon]